MAEPVYGINLVGVKTCSKCHVEKPFADFHKRANRRSGRMSSCRSCESARKANRGVEVKREYYERYRVKALAYYRKRSYGISQEQYTEMVIQQQGRCAICCGVETARNKRGELRELSVDHDHGTGRVRGLLCAACNCALGYMKDDPARLNAAAKYLKGGGNHRWV